MPVNDINESTLLSFLIYTDRKYEHINEMQDIICVPPIWLMNPDLYRKMFYQILLLNLSSQVRVWVSNEWAHGSAKLAKGD